MDGEVNKRNDWHTPHNHNNNGVHTQRYQQVFWFILFIHRKKDRKKASWREKDKVKI